MAKILDGKKLSEEILENLKKEIKKRNLRLRLAVVQVGEKPVSKIFINQKKKLVREWVLILNCVNCRRKSEPRN